MPFELAVPHVYFYLGFATFSFFAIVFVFNPLSGIAHRVWVPGFLIICLLNGCLNIFLSEYSRIAKDYVEARQSLTADLSDRADASIDKHPDFGDWATPHEWTIDGELRTCKTTGISQGTLDHISQRKYRAKTKVPRREATDTLAAIDPTGVNLLCQTDADGEDYETIIG